MAGSVVDPSGVAISGATIIKRFHQTGLVLDIGDVRQLNAVLEIGQASDSVSNYFEPTRPEFLDPQQLCLPLGPVRQLTWHDVHILQYPGYVIFEHEGRHVFRLIPLDGRPHVGSNIKLWMGDSRGHWGGNTSVVDVTNNNSKGRLRRAGDFASDKLHVLEHFQFIDADHVRYEAKFDDPSVYTRPWTFGFDVKRAIFGESNPTKDDAHYEQWEEACYEG